jgi:hypothetical protein
MPDFFSQQMAGVADNTQIPSRKADGGQVGAKISSITASKPLGQALAATDRLYLGRVRAGERIKAILITTDTSLGTSTIAIGTTATPAKYVAATTFTTPLDRPTAIGPRASTLDDGVLTADEDIWATVAVATIVGTTIFSIELEITSVK